MKKLGLEKTTRLLQLTSKSVSLVAALRATPNGR